MKKKVLIFVASFLVFTLIFGGVYLKIRRDQLRDPHFEQIIKDNPNIKPPDASKSKVVNTLFLGVDEARSDVMIVASYNKQNHKITLLSIPRDTRVSIPKYGYDKINSAAARKEGAALAMETVSDMLNMPIHHYVRVDFKGAEKIIDILGGVTVNVPRNMYYNDPTQKLRIDIKKGEQLLNGENAVKFVRFRSGYADQDLGRIKAQQEFIRAFVSKITSPAVIPKSLTLINAMVKYVKTNMDDDDIALYALNLRNIELDNIKMFTVPGKPGYTKGVAYYIYDEQGLSKTLDEISEFLGIQVNDSSMAEMDKGTIKIEVVNGTGREGLAFRYKMALEAKGYNVVRQRDLANITYDASKIINRSGKGKATDIVAKDTGISIIESDVKNDLDYDLTIILGKDKTN